MTVTDTRVAAAIAAGEEGMATVENGADPRLIAEVDAKIAELNATGEKWSANDCRDLVSVAAASLVGPRVHAAALRRPREQRKVGMTRSTLLSTKGAWIAVWEGCAS
ncbi:hypothetical protein L2K70_04875 [Nocardioides KLBMP 9356]|uniref:DUF222 domain-containing protein n=1 Tax=Nocardioides potassii TaxID=2911371 RepID=A0ABS9H8Y2_9ACTN|nr:hypothetical protein [Nocardioides potassii]MCF6376929.1 hypothetical protein [Nocardioides potassii]